MKKQILAGFLIIFLTALLVGPAQTQEILTVTPSSGFAGETAYPVIVCNNTQLMTDFDYIEIGDPTLIQVLSAEVKNNFELEVIIDISPLAEPDEHSDITIYLNDGSSIQKENAFLVKAAGDFEVMLTVIPADPLYLSAFDPDAPQNSPLLFTVQLMNEWKDLDYVRVEFIVENPEYGELGSAYKIYDMGLLKGHPYEVFDNREFDQYNVTSSAMDLLDDAMQTGMLPPGTYDYYINVYDNNDSLIGQDQGFNIVTNLLTSIDLVGPGNSLDHSPETIFSPNPYFQWFSAAVSYDFTLYEVMDGQTAPDEITSNLPVYEVPDMGVTELLYPTYAELLVKGKTYAWQVKAYFEGSMGEETIFSDVFWFQYQQGNGFVLDRIEVNPEDIAINANETYQFSAIGYDTNNDTIQIRPTWQVIPTSAGLFDEQGMFTAGSTPGVVAVVASYNGMQSYSTVTINGTGIEGHGFGLWELFRDTYGLPR